MLSNQVLLPSLGPVRDLNFKLTDTTERERERGGGREGGSNVVMPNVCSLTPQHPGEDGSMWVWLHPLGSHLV